MFRAIFRKKKKSVQKRGYFFGGLGILGQFYPFLPIFTLFYHIPGNISGPGDQFCD